MVRLRDIDLRWAELDQPPESFWKRGPVEYLFYRKLRGLKIETPGFVKINVYGGPMKQDYSGAFHDGVTAVHVVSRWSDIERLATKNMAAACAGLLAEGAETVLSHFAITAAKSMPALAGQVQMELFAPYVFGKPATRVTGERLSARLQIRCADTLEYCTVTVALKRGRTPLGELPICTTFPNFDYAIENLDSLSWTSSTELTVTFATYGANDHRVFGRRNFDSSELADVKVTNSADRRRRSFTIDASSLLTPG